MRARWKDYTKKNHQEQEHLNLDFGALGLDIHIWALDKIQKLQFRRSH